ncbi:MAG: hypothetical protein CM15mP62_21000 [Rhodospirillaceae bacterium]|nr:MAG: hypothetical protein CM15mP62_21000 [Rhodospirillaceae bacterium]
MKMPYRTLDKMSAEKLDAIDLDSKLFLSKLT